MLLMKELEVNCKLLRKINYTNVVTVVKPVISLLTGNEINTVCVPNIKVNLT